VLAVAVAAAALAALPAVPAGNLVRNPGAEAGQASQSGETTVPIPDWTTTSTFTVAPYGGGGAPDFFTFPPPSESQRIGGGKNFFAGGFKAGTSTASQTIDVSRGAPFVDQHLVRASLGAWLGGYLSQTDPGTVRAEFIGGSGAILGSLEIGPVTPEERDRDLKLVQKAASIDVPTGTRGIRLTMTAVQVDGTYDDAYFDNLSLTLEGPALAMRDRCLSRKRVTVTAGIPPGLKGRSVTFRAGRRTTVDRKAPFTTTFVRRTASPVVTATGVVTVGVQRGAISGRLAVHCP
jgi:hypothetical protein